MRAGRLRRNILSPDIDPAAALDVAAGIVGTHACGPFSAVGISSRFGRVGTGAQRRLPRPR